MYKNKIEEARNLLLQATKILGSLIEEEVQESDLEDWMKVRVELWCRVYNEGGVVTREKLHEIWVNTMHKDARGLGGFFVGRNASLTWTSNDKAALTKNAADSIESWTGSTIAEYAKRFK
jgi:hypothetical protein